MPDGFKTFAVGETLTAADVNGYLMEQVISVHADATARDAAITSPAEGQVAYLSDVNDLTVYTGAGWVDLSTLVAEADIDHGALSGLADDDHTQYVRVDATRDFTATPEVNNNVIWHAGNDGPGSGLDADTVDGLAGGSLLRSDASDSYTSGTLTFSGGTTLDADAATAVTVPSSTTSTHALRVDVGDARYLGIAAKAADSQLLDSLDSTAFLRSDAADSFTGTLTAGAGGSLEMADKAVGSPKLHDVSEDVNTVAASGATETLDHSAANVHDVTLTANCTFTFSNPPASGDAGTLTLILRQDGTGSRTATWPASVDWADGTAPTLSTAASAVDVLTFLTVDGGTTWLGFVGGQAFA